MNDLKFYKNYFRNVIKIFDLKLNLKIEFKTSL